MNVSTMGYYLKMMVLENICCRGRGKRKNENEEKIKRGGESGRGSPLSVKKIEEERRVFCIIEYVFFREVEREGWNSFVCLAPST